MSSKPAKTFAKADLWDCLFKQSDSLVSVKNELVDTHRWSIEYNLVFEERATGRLYRISYEIGATEIQDFGPFEFEGDFIECTEVKPVEITRIIYQDVQADER